MKDREVLKEEIRASEETIIQLQAEIERLTIRLRKAEHQLDDLCKMHNIIKSEAIKEFAERLKKEALKHKIFPLDSCVDFDDIDNLVKEMTEQKNDFKE